MKVGVSEHAVAYINVQSFEQYCCSSSNCCILPVKIKNHNEIVKSIVRVTVTNIEHVKLTSLHISSSLFFIHT